MSLSGVKAAGMVIGGLFLFSGCQEVEDSTHDPVEIWGRQLDGLVEAYGAPPLNRRDGGLLEILRIGKSWKSYDRGRFHASSSSQDELMVSLRWMKDRCESEGFDPRLVVSAPAHMPFREIREVIRAAAIAGVCEIEFLIDQPSSRESSLSFSLPTGHGCGVAPGVEAPFVRVEADGMISIGRGAARSELDGDSSDRTLPGLDERLRNYSRAAEAVGCVPSVDIHVEPNAPYQRMIDVLACLEWNGIRSAQFADLVDGPETTCSGMVGSELRLEQKEKPRSPSRQLSGFPPPEEVSGANQLPDSPFGPDLK